jgi:hypothetical protein
MRHSGVDMKFQSTGDYQEDLQPVIDELRAYQMRHGFADDAAGRAQAVKQMIAEEWRPRKDGPPHLEQLQILVDDYDPAKSAQIDPWLKALVSARPEIAARSFVDCNRSSLKLDGLVALLRAGVDLACPVPGLELPIAKDGKPGQAIVDASPIAAMLCFYDHDGWPLLEQKGLLPCYDQAPYAGCFREPGGSVVEISLLDYLMKMNPDADEHLFALRRLNAQSQDVRLALADGAIKLLKHLHSIHERDAYDSDEYISGNQIVRSALMIGAGADMEHLVDGLRDQKPYCLPFMLAEAKHDEYRGHIAKALDVVAHSASQPYAALADKKVFDLGYRTIEGLTPLHRAAAYGYFEVVASFVAAGADVNAKGENMQTPLHAAIDAFSEETVRNVEVLLQAGADVDAKFGHGVTAEELAIDRGRHNIAQMIAAHRARNAVHGVLQRANNMLPTSQKS